MTKDAIIAILRQFSVCQHTAATAAHPRRLPRYAVWSKFGQVSEQVSEPSSHAEAQRAREELIATEIVALAERAKGGAA